MNIPIRLARFISPYRLAARGPALLLSACCHHTPARATRPPHPLTALSPRAAATGAEKNSSPLGGQLPPADALKTHESQ